MVVTMKSESLDQFILMDTGVNVDAYPFLTFWDLPLHLEDSGIGVFFFGCKMSDSKRQNLEGLTEYLVAYHY